LLQHCCTHPTMAMLRPIHGNYKSIEATEHRPLV
jgi:hypothetical protein